MIVACHQPNYLPHLGFFHKMKQADVFVILDTVQFSDGVYQHRNRIRTDTGWKWLTIPVDRTFQPIQNVKIKNDVRLSGRPWQTYHWDSIQNSYAKTPYFEKFAPALAALYQRPYENLADATIDIITHLKNVAGIATPLIRASTLNIDASDASLRLAKLTEVAGGTVYLTGSSGGTTYELREKPFEERGISIMRHEFSHPVYDQYHARRDNSFEKNLAAIDALFNTGTLLL